MCATSTITFAFACAHTILYSCQMQALIFDTRCRTRTQDYSHARTYTLSTHTCIHPFSHSFLLYHMCHVTNHICLCLHMYNPILTLNNPYLIHSHLYTPILHSFLLYHMPPSFFATRNTRQCLLTQNDELHHCLHHSHHSFNIYPLYSCHNTNTITITQLKCNHYCIIYSRFNVV
jgi:hypothetical protein